VSRTPVREALQRLQQEGYVLGSPGAQQSRLTVAPLTRDDVTAVESNGVIDTAGKRYRFQIEDLTNKGVHDLLEKWFAAGQASSGSN